jgi:hypothetical protein
MGSNRLVVVGLVLAAAIASQPAVAGPHMISSWQDFDATQDECVRRGSEALRRNGFTTKFAVLGNASIYGQRGGYTALVRCAAEKRFILYAVAGPSGTECSRHMTAIKDKF